MCSLGNLSSSIVANMGVESSDKHEGLVEQPVDLLPVGHDAHYTVVSEGNTGVAKESDGAEDVSDHHWLEHVEFKMSIGTTNSDCHVVAHHLPSHHSDRFTLGGVHLEWGGFRIEVIIVYK